MKEEKKRKREIKPEKFQMVWCPACKGTGRSPNKDAEVKVCTLCGGFGWVRKEACDA